jgi:hypothetical protein
LRVAFAVILVLSAGAVAGSDATAKANVAETEDDSAVRLEERLNRSTVDDSAAATTGLTVVATQGFYVSDEQAELVAFSESGEVVYYDDSYRVYFDVYSVPEKRFTVDYLASKHRNGTDCANVPTERCTYNVFTRVNLTTGEEREIYGEVTPRIYSARWHDIDWYNDTHIVVADIVQDSLRLVDTRTDETTWRWNASRIYDRDQGGKSGDWTHVNDVEVTPDGRIVASMRNMDQVIFVEPGAGADENWTLGEDDNHDILYEQHNPDDVPASDGGPAILVADSENGRVVEYQRTDGEWTRTWGWRDSRLQWPRDADRLPDDNTLIVDTHGDRVVEVAPDGEVVWNVTIGMPYDVERLGTGDESTGGRSTTAIGRSDGTITSPDAGLVASFWLGLKELVPSLVVNGLLYSAPSWVRFTDLAFAFAFLVGLLGWLTSEVYWSRYSPVAFVRSLPDRVRSV